MTAYDVHQIIRPTEEYDPINREMPSWFRWPNEWTREEVEALHARFGDDEVAAVNLDNEAPTMRPTT